MTYRGSKNLRYTFNSKGQITGTLTDEQIIKDINTSFGLKGTVTKVVLS